MGDDAFGKAFLDFYSGRETELVFERNDGYSDPSDVLVYFREYGEFPDYEKRVLSYVKGKVLDIGCGAGRHSLWLQGRGLDVTSFDSSPRVMELCRLRGVGQPILGSVQNLPFKESTFDTIVLLGNGFGLAGRLEDTCLFLRRLHEVTKDDGLVLADSKNYLLTREEAHLRYHEMNRDNGRPAGEVTIRAKCGSEVSSWFHLLMVTPKEMENICEKTGWCVEEFFEYNEPVFGAVLRKAML